MKDFLQQHFSADQYSDALSDREEHSIDYSFHTKTPPLYVVWPKTTEQVSVLLKYAHENGVPVTPWGKGTSLEGNPIPVQGGIALDMGKMDRIVEVQEHDLQVRVQSGMIGDDLNAALERYNLFFPAAPGSSHIASIGGMIANNAGGMYAVKYGVVGEWVKKMTVVLANGEILELGSRSPKNVAGYDLKSLFIGSEGTLGVITEATLALKARPESRVGIMTSFSNVTRACLCTLEILRSDLTPAACELMTADYVQLVNDAKKIHLPVQPTLIIEFHDRQEVIDMLIPKIEMICEKYNKESWEVTKNEDERQQLWRIRKAVRPKVAKMFPDQGIIPGDIGVPLSEIPEFIQKCSQLQQETGVKTIPFGHAGDGNFHVWTFYRLGDDQSYEQAVQVNEILVSYAIERGGTSTAEHGIGIGKRKYLKKQYPQALYWMKQVKDVFDPKGILNPGKIFE